MHPRTAVLLALSAALLVPSRGVAQGPIASLQAGVTQLEDEGGLFEVGARFSPRGTLGAEVSIDLYPAALTANALAGVVDFSLVANLRLGPAAIVPRAGVSIVAAVGGGAVAAGGFGGGVGLVLTIDSRTALRADYTYRRLMVGDEMYTVPSVTAGFVIHH